MTSAAGQQGPGKTGRGEDSGNSHNNPSSDLKVQAVELPEGAVQREQATRREKRFLERFDKATDKIEQVYHPGEKRYYPFRGARRDFIDPYTLVAETLRRLGIFEPALLDQLPHNRVLRYSLGGGGWIRKKKPKVVVCAAVQSPVEDLARFGGTVTPLGRGAVRAVVDEYVRDSSTFHVLGILSTVGWDADVTAAIPRGDNYVVLLIEETETGAWRVQHSLPEELANLALAFDPEHLDEKVLRVATWIQNHMELRIPGGHTDVERAVETLQVERIVFDRGVEQVQQEDGALKVETVGGREILKRDRY